MKNIKFHFRLVFSGFIQKTGCQKSSWTANYAPFKLINSCVSVPAVRWIFNFVLANEKRAHPFAYFFKTANCSILLLILSIRFSNFLDLFVEALDSEAIAMFFYRQIANFVANRPTCLSRDATDPWIWYLFVFIRVHFTRCNWAPFRPASKSHI